MKVMIQFCSCSRSTRFHENPRMSHESESIQGDCVFENQDCYNVCQKEWFPKNLFHIQRGGVDHMKGVAEEDAVPQGIRKVLDSGVRPGYPEMEAC